MHIIPTSIFSFFFFLVCVWNERVDIGPPHVKKTAFVIFLLLFSPKPYPMGKNKWIENVISVWIYDFLDNMRIPAHEEEKICRGFNLGWRRIGHWIPTKKRRFAGFQSEMKKRGGHSRHLRTSRARYHVKIKYLFSSLFYKDLRNMFY